MKLWMLLPTFLPDPLLARQHQTLHAIFNGVLRRKPRRGITRFLRYGGFVAWLHYVTVVEMMARGWHHETPLQDLWARLPADQRRFDYVVRPEEVRADISLVRSKMRSGNFAVSMMTATLPLDVAGMQLVEAQRKVVLVNALPDGALYL